MKRGIVAICADNFAVEAYPAQPGKGEQGPGAPYNAAAKFYQVYSGDSARDHDLRIAVRGGAHSGAN